MATKVSTPMLQPDTQFGLVPPGAVMSFAMSAAPMGWLPCDGAAINRTTYAPLFSAIGYIHGGSGNSFNVPDLRGEFIRGWSAGRAVDTGRVFGSSQVDEYKSHSHNVNNQSSEGPQWLAFSRNDLSPSAVNDGTAYTAGGLGNDRIFYIVNSGGTETRPRNITLLYCIKF